MVRRYREGAGRKVVLLLSACMIGLLAQACQSSAPLTRMGCGSCEDQDRIVRLQAASHPSEHLAFTHPFLLSPEDWKVILRSIRVQRRNEAFLFFTTKGAVEQAFSDDETEYLGATLSRVFAQARPDEKVVFALSRRPSDVMTEVTTGGWFVNGEFLHFVLANYRFAVTMPGVRERLWQDPLRTEAGPFYEFAPGEHQTVAEEQRSSRRLFFTTLPSLTIAYKPLLLGEPAFLPAARSAPAGSDSSSSPNRTSPAKLSLEERLQTLKRLKDQGLITDEEYRIKRTQVLDQF